MNKMFLSDCDIQLCSDSKIVVIPYMIDSSDLSELMKSIPEKYYKIEGIDLYLRDLKTNGLYPVFNKTLIIYMENLILTNRITGERIMDSYLITENRLENILTNLCKFIELSFQKGCNCKYESITSDKIDFQQ